MWVCSANDIGAFRISLFYLFERAEAIGQAGHKKEKGTKVEDDVELWVIIGMTWSWSTLAVTYLTIFSHLFYQNQDPLSFLRAVSRFLLSCVISEPIFCSFHPLHTL